MDEIKILTEDVEVPGIVREKADHVLDEIRKGERAPQPGRSLVRPMMAACAALMILAGGLGGVCRQFGLKAVQGGQNVTPADRIDRIFTLHVEAAELEPGRAVPFQADNGEESWVLGTLEDGDEVSYCINIPFRCEGEGIESVSYSINQGAFQIVQPEGEKSILVAGERYGGDLDTGLIGGDYDEERDGLSSKNFEHVLYRSYTLDYDRQSDEDTWINICGVYADGGRTADLIWAQDGTPRDHSERLSLALDQMLGDTVVTCTVRYEDGAVRQGNIRMGGQVVEDAQLGGIACISLELE